MLCATTPVRLDHFKTFTTAMHINLRISVVLYLAITVVISVSASAASDTPCIMIGSLTSDKTDTLITQGKMEASVYLAFDLAKQRLAGRTEIDSAIRKLAIDSSATLEQAARAVGCSSILFMRTSRFARLVRTEISIASASNSEPQRTGVGYGSITYARSDTELVADPAILASTQRALHAVLRTDPRFDTLSSELRIVPADLIAVSGIAYLDDVGLPPWQIFTERTVTSFDVVQTIVGTLQSVDSLVVVDIETRDQMFEKAGFYMAENDRATSDIEMRVLRGFDIGKMITGTLSHTKDGVVLQLFNTVLLANGTYQVVGSAQCKVADDTKTDLREAVVSATNKLFGLAGTAK